MTKARDLASSGLTLTATTTTADAALAKAGGTMTGNLAMGTNLVDGVDVSARDAVLTDTTTKATAALPKSGGAMTGAITTNSTFDGVDIATRDAVLSSTVSTATNALNNANNALPKEGGAMSGAITTNSTFDGVDVGARDSVLTSTTTTANAALPKAGGAMTGAITTNSTIDGRDVAADGVLATNALPKAGGAITGQVNSVFAGGGDFIHKFQNTTAGTPYGVMIKDASSGSTGYPLLNIANHGGNITHFRVDSGAGRVGFGAAPSSASQVTIQGPAGSSGNEISTKALHIIEGGYNTGPTFQVSDASSNSRFQVDGNGKGIFSSKLFTGTTGTTFATNLATSASLATFQVKTHASDSTVMNFGGITGGTGYITRTNGGGSATYPICVNPYGGNLLVGTTAAGYPAYADNLTVGSSTANCGITIRSATNGQGNIYWSDATGTGGGTFVGYISFSHTDNSMQFASANAERMRLNTTGVLEKYGNSTSARIVPQSDNTGYLGEGSHRWQAVYAVNGSIQTSDQRQKTDIQNSSLGLDFIKALRPVSYKWISGGKDITYAEDDLVQKSPIATDVAGVRNHYGLLAQEVKTVLGDTDFGGWVLEDTDDADSVQSLRYDQFVAPLIKAIQEQQTIIEALTARVTALEA